MTGCQVHGYHTPKPLRLVEHHVWPRGMGGPDTPANKILACDTGHASIHQLLAVLCQTGELPKGRGGRLERGYALRGFQAWVDAGRPGRPERLAALGHPVPVADGIEVIVSEEE